MKFASYDFNRTLMTADMLIKIGYIITKPIYIDWLGRYAVKYSERKKFKGNWQKRVKDIEIMSLTR